MNRTPRRMRQSRYDELYARKAEGFSTRAQIGQGILIVAAFIYLLGQGLGVYLLFSLGSLSGSEELSFLSIAQYCGGIEAFLGLLLCILVLRGNAGARNLLGGLMTWSGLRACGNGLIWLALRDQLPIEFLQTFGALVTITLTSGGLYGGLGLLTFTPMVNAYLDEI